jgi:hypothetical protein
METKTSLFDDIVKLATRFVPGTPDAGPVLERRRKDLDALVAVGRIAGGGVQTAAMKQYETLRALGEDLRGALIQETEGDRTRIEGVREAARKAIGGVAEAAELLVNAQAEAFDAVSQRARASVEELKSLSSPKQ